MIQPPVKIYATVVIKKQHGGRVYVMTLTGHHKPICSLFYGSNYQDILFLFSNMAKLVPMGMYVKQIDVFGHTQYLYRKDLENIPVLVRIQQINGKGDVRPEHVQCCL